MDALNFDRVVNSFIEQAKGLDRNTFTRIAHIALPYLNFHPQVGRYAQAAVGAYDVLGNVISLNRLDKSKLAERLVHISLSASTIALTILSPAIALQLSTLFSIATNSVESIYHISQAEYRQAFLSACSSLGFSIQYAAIVYTSTGTLAASLLVSSAQYLAQAYREFYNDENSWLQLFEAASHCLLAANTLRTSAPLVSELYTNYVKQELTYEQKHAFLEELERLCDEGSSTEVELPPFPLEEELRKEQRSISEKSDRFDMVKFLKKHDHPTTIRNVKFTIDLRKVHFDGISFEECQMSGYWYECFLRNTRFSRCKFKRFELSHCEHDNLSIQGSALSGLSMYSTKGNDFEIVDCTDLRFFLQNRDLEGVIKKCSILHANLAKTKMSFEECHFDQPLALANAKLDKCTFSKRGETPIAFPTYEDSDLGEFAENIQKVLMRNGAEILACPRKTKDTEQLTQEVTALLSKYKPECGLSRTQYLFAHADPKGPIAKVYEVAQNAVKASQGVVLPGGPDVCPALYRPMKESESMSNLDQSVMEAAYVIAAEKLKKPILGVCRGHQLIAVVYGGTLKKTPHGDGFQRLVQAEKPSRFARRFFAPILVDQRPVCFSAHYEAIDKRPEGFEVVMTYKDVIKAMVKDGRIITSQIHPEVIEEFDAEERLENESLKMIITSLKSSRVILDMLRKAINLNERRLLRTTYKGVVQSQLQFDRQEQLYRNFVELASKSG